MRIPKDLIPQKAVADDLCVSLVTLWRARRSGIPDFPEPVILRNMIFWRKQHIQQLESELRDAKTGIEKARISAESSERVAQINANSKQDVEELKGWIAMLMESMRPPPSLNAAAMKTQEQQNQEPTTAQGPGQPPEYAPGQQY